jgi:glycosyltransferase involved in cell wall biosynthesis
MVLHVFNSGLISGPETLVVPALKTLGSSAAILWLRESRVAEKNNAAVYDYFSDSGLKLYIIDVNSRIDLTAIEALRRLLQTLNPGIVHAHDVKPSCYVWAALRNQKTKRPRLVNTHHGVYGRPGPITRTYERFYAYFVAPDFDRTLVVCTQDYDRLRERSFPLNKLRLHFNGVTRPLVAVAQQVERRSQIREAWGVEASSAVPLYGIIARLSVEKRHSVALQMIRELLNQSPKFVGKFLIFGQGTLENALKQQCQELRLQNHVLWMGHRPYVGSELAGLNGVISLSRSEGLPINLIEAGWAGAPVFATEVDGTKDLIIDQIHGRLVPVTMQPKELALEFSKFTDDAERLQNQGIAFQSHVQKHFSQDVWVKKLLEIYEELFNEKDCLESDKNIEASKPNGFGQRSGTSHTGLSHNMEASL